MVPYPMPAAMRAMREATPLLIHNLTYLPNAGRHEGDERGDTTVNTPLLIHNLTYLPNACRHEGDERGDTTGLGRHEHP